jgi:hypothetical protein
MHKAQSNWLPLSIAPQVNLDMAEFYLNKARDAADEDVEMQTYCVTKAVDFIYDDANMMDMVAWFLEHDSTVVIKGKALKMEIKSELGYSIIRKIFKCEELNCEQEELLFDEVFQKSLTDTMMRIKKECQYSRPDPKLKS